MQDYMTVLDLNKITKVNKTTLSTLLSRSEFDKLGSMIKIKNVVKRAYIFNQTFVEALSNILIKKKKLVGAKLLNDYWELKQQFKKKNKEKQEGLDKEIEEILLKNKGLENQLDLTSKHYDSLLTRYKEMYLINQGYENILKQVLDICNETADNMAVVDMQKRIKGLIDNEQIDR